MLTETGFIIGCCHLKKPAKSGRDCHIVLGNWNVEIINLIYVYFLYSLMVLNFFAFVLIYYSRCDKLLNLTLFYFRKTYPGWFSDRFNTTVPMSTYLVAYIVSDFGFKTTIYNNITFRIWARQEALDQVSCSQHIHFLKISSISSNLRTICKWFTLLLRLILQLMLVHKF